MKRIFFSLCLVMSFSLWLFGQNANDLIKKSDDLYYNAKSVQDFDNLIKFLKDAEWNNKDNYEITWRTGRAISEKAVILLITYMNDNMKKRKITDVDDILDSDKDLEKEQENTLLNLGTEGIYYMEKAKKLNSSRVETFYYHALSISMYGLGKSVVSALLEGISGKYETALNGAININKTYAGSGALRSFGRYYYILPWPKRDLDESEKYLKEAVQLSPNEMLGHIYLGDTFWKLDKKKEAKEEWQKAKNTGNPDGLEKILFNAIKNIAGKRISLN
jgi:tetratricopeptide (TPR) repeat protein